MTRMDLWNRANEKANLFFNLWERWQDEHEYEDINDYLKHIQQTFPEAYSITKRPFGIKCKADDGAIQITVKRSGNSIKLCGKNI